MSKSYLLAILMLSIVGPSQAQIEGRYSDDEEFIELRNGIAEFEVFSNGGLIVQLRGTGPYEIFNNYLLIHAISDKNLRQSRYDTTRSTNTPKMTFVDEHENPIIGINITWEDQLAKTTGISGGSGTIEISQLKSETINASMIGYDDITIKLLKGLDYRVIMAEGMTLENQTIVFKIISISNDSIELKLLSEHFDASNKKAKALAKLERKVNSEDVRLRRYLK